MSSLVLVRHGQASFLAADYDRLSATGEAQARLLGAYWVRRRLGFDAIFTGPRLRHRQTAALVGECFREAGRPWPESVVVPELDEHEAVNLLTQRSSGLFQAHPHLGELADALRRATTPEEKQRGFQRLFEAVVVLWSAHGAAGILSWDAYRERVRAGLARVTDGGRGRRVAAFTSVGPITVALQQALQCADRTALELGWRLRNCSLSEFVYTAGRFTLDSFNGLPHLEDAALWTYL